MRHAAARMAKRAAVFTVILAVTLIGAAVLGIVVNLTMGQP